MTASREAVRDGLIAVPNVVCWRDEGKELREDLLAREEPLEILAQGRAVAVLMRTPGMDAALAVGFLLTEGIVNHPSDVLEVSPCQMGEQALHGNVLNVFLRSGVEVDFERLTRHTYAGSSCGLCGKATIESIHQRFPPLTDVARVRRDLLLDLPARLRDGQSGFAASGGSHAAGLFSTDGAVLSLHEDVGRHNAVDKVIGEHARAFPGRWPFERTILMVSGRASFEILQKALAARIGIVAAVSAPSSLAVEFARESGQTLAGFLRGRSMNLYAHPERVADGS
jgi:FdhD protein